MTTWKVIPFSMRPTSPIHPFACHLTGTATVAVVVVVRIGRWTGIDIVLLYQLSIAVDFSDYVWTHCKTYVCVSISAIWSSLHPSNMGVNVDCRWNGMLFLNIHNLRTYNYYTRIILTWPKSQFAINQPTCILSEMLLYHQLFSIFLILFHFISFVFWDKTWKTHFYWIIGPVSIQHLEPHAQSYSNNRAKQKDRLISIWV